MKKYAARYLYWLMVFSGAVLLACENRQPEKTAAPTPNVFSPEAEPRTDQPDSLPAPEPAFEPEPEPAPQPAATRQPMPTVAELKTITQSQEAKRALSNDAMKAFSMKPDAFAAYMKSRIPYYQGKGDLQTANDVVKIEINATEMVLETAKGRQVFPMQ